MSMDTGLDQQTSSTAALRTENLTRIVDDKRLVDGVSVEIGWGETLAVVGPSGAGKSSFLRLLNRLDEPSSGTVYLEGRDYRDIPPRELRRIVGMVMQQPFLFPGTVEENLRFGPRQRGEDLEREQLEALLEKVNLPGYLERYVSRLSGGEAQRVSLARTLANRPRILLLDEPTSALDEESRRDVEELIAQIIDLEKLTCVIVTHDMKQAERMSKRVMVMEKGKKVRIGPVEEVLASSQR